MAPSGQLRLRGLLRFPVITVFFLFAFSNNEATLRTAAPPAVLLSAQSPRMPWAVCPKPWPQSEMAPAALAGALPCPWPSAREKTTHPHPSSPDTLRPPTGNSALPAFIPMSIFFFLSRMEAMARALSRPVCPSHRATLCQHTHADQQQGPGHVGRSLP